MAHIPPAKTYESPTWCRYFQAPVDVNLEYFSISTNRQKDRYFRNYGVPETTFSYTPIKATSRCLILIFQ